MKQAKKPTRATRATNPPPPMRCPYCKFEGSKFQVKQHKELCRGS